MKEVLLTSSVLILAVFLVRVLFQKAISRRVQYALWGACAAAATGSLSAPGHGAQCANCLGASPGHDLEQSFQQSCLYPGGPGTAVPAS